MSHLHLQSTISFPKGPELEILSQRKLEGNDMTRAKSLYFILQEIFVSRLSRRTPATVITIPYVVGLGTVERLLEDTPPLARFCVRTRNRFQNYVWYGLLHTAGVRRTS